MAKLPPSREVQEKKRAYHKAYRIRNAKKIKADSKEYRKSHAKEIREYNIQYRLSHPETPIQIEARKISNKKSYDKRREKILAQKSEYWFANKERLSAEKKIYVKNNKDKIYAQQKIYYELNKEWRYAKTREWVKINRKTNIQFRLSLLLRDRFSKALKGNFKNGSAVRDLGCSIEYFKTYLEKQFTSGMNWENYGKWHIDHIRPLATFDLTDREQVLEALHYTNMQPLWAIDNLRKSRHYEIANV